MRSSRTRALFLQLAAAFVATALVALGSVGPALAAADDPVFLVPSSIVLGDADPGTSKAVPVRFFNSGPTASEGLTFIFGGYRTGVDLRRYGDCSYYHRTDGLWGVVCQVAGTVRPGTNYEIVAPDGKPVQLDIAPDAQGPWAQWSSFHVYPVYAGSRVPEKQIALQADASRGFSKVTKGTGAPLRIVEKGTAAAPASGWRPNVTSFQMRTTANPFDFEVFGAQASGQVGDTVTTTIGVRNHGPSTVLVGEHQVGFSIKVIIPAGAKAVEVPRYCVPATEDWYWDTDAATPGQPRYLCNFADIHAGKQETFPFKLEITEVVPDATGTLKLKLGKRKDSETSNNTAKIVLNPTPAEEPTPGETPEPGGGGGLPVTGSDVTGLVLVAAIFLALGTSLFVVNRRA